MTKILLLCALLFSSSVVSAKKNKSDVVVLKISLSTKGTDIAFDQSSIQVPFGKTVQLTYINQADANSEISHNVAIVKLGAEKELDENLKKHDYDLDKIDQSLILAKTKVLEPGQKDTITFKPETKGVYTYICLMPAHGNMLGMKGFLNVK